MATLGATLKIIRLAGNPAALGIALALAACTPDTADMRQPAQVVPVASHVGFDALFEKTRRESNLVPLKQSAILTRVAQAHADDMSANNYFSHRSRGGKSAADRARAGGYDYCWIGENIAQGQRSVAEVMDSWMTSPGHRRNNMAREAREYGLGRTADNYWVLMIGSRDC